MVERQHRSPLNLYITASIAAGASIDLPDDAAHHARVRRVQPGDPVQLSDGAGTLGEGVIESVTKSIVRVAVRTATAVQRPPALHMLVPVADRDRMLVAAEKCAELQVTSWQPVLWARSRSVSPRGEGERFREKVTARMVAALEQSGGAWLPELRMEADPARLLESIEVPARFILHQSGAPLRPADAMAPAALAIGPEGGFEPDELSLATSLGWVQAALGSSILRFETAVIAGAAVIRANQYLTRS
jgi:16S rRNA (uracil1498-N3)-methyltransferase